ncbi:equilibrative nucleobase transporter 1-like [Glandiceps talaboti]
MMSTVVFLSFQKLHEAGISMQAQFTFLLFFTSCLFLVNTFYVVPAEKIMDVCPGETPKYYPELYGEECVRLKEHGYKGKDLMPNSNGLVQQTEHCVSDLNLFHQIPIKTYSAFMNQVEVNVCSNKKRGSFRHTICTPMFLWFVVWSAVMTFREYYFIGTLNPFLGFITNGNEADVDHYTAVFGYISLGVIFVAPLVGLVMDSKGDSPLFTAITAIMITTSHTVLYSLTVLIPLIEVQIVTFVLVTIQRGFIHGVLSSFIGMAFPQDHYGKFYGFVYLVAGLITLMQSPLFTLSQKSNNEDPFYVNIGILAFTLLAHGHPIYIWYYCDRDLKEKITEKREEKKEPLISPTTDGYI